MKKVKKIKKRPWLFFGLLSVLAGLLCFLHWKQLHVPNDHFATPYFSDLYFHFHNSMRSNTGFYSLVSPIIRIPYMLTGSENVAAVVFTIALAGSTVASVLLVRYWYGMVYGKTKSRWINGLALSSVMVSMLLSPRTFTGESDAWYITTGISPNVWHNPTTLLCRPFSLWVLIMTYKIIKAYKEEKPFGKLLFWNAWAAFMSVWAKPSFLMTFLLAFCVYLLLEIMAAKGKRKEQFLFSVKMGLSYVPAVCMVLWQYLFLFEGEKDVESGIAFRWILSASEIIKILVLSAGFVTAAAVLFSLLKMKRNVWLFGAFWLTLGLIFKAFIAETGERATDGNFDWMLIITLFFLFMLCAGELLLKERPALKRWEKLAVCLVSVLYGAHLVTGIAWFIRILTGTRYG